LEDWKRRALGSIPPYFSNDEFLLVIEFFAFGMLNKQFVLKQDLNKLLTLYLREYELSSKEIDAVHYVSSEVLHRLEAIDLVKVSGNIISASDFEKIEELHSLFKFVRQSTERLVRWTLYHLYQEKNAITIENIQKLNTDLSKEKITSTLARVVRACAEAGLKLSQKGSTYTIGPNQDRKFIAKCLVDVLELRSRASSQELEDDILKALDLFPHSNKDLAITLDIDESTTSRVLKRLNQQKYVHIVAPGDYGRQYWLTNCDNCPWGMDKMQCRTKSILTLKELFKERFKSELQDDEFEDLENQSLRHLVELFLKIPYPNGIELKKRRVLSRLLEKAATSTGFHISGKDFDYNYFDKQGKLRPLVLPIPYLMGLHNGMDLGGRLMSGLLDRVMEAKEAEKLRKRLANEFANVTEQKGRD
jgi:hypothetical protein